MDFIRYTLTPSLPHLYIECHPLNKQFLRCIAIPSLNCNSLVVLRCFVVVFNYLLVAVAMGPTTIYVTAIVALIFNVLYLQGVMGATFAIQNQCSYTVWAAGIPVGGGQALGQGQSWSVDVPAGTSSGRFWGRTGCSFDASGKGSCSTGDCGGVLSCTLSGQPPTTLVEYTLNGGNNQDFYDISVIDGYNVPLSLTPSDASCQALTCKMDQCPDAYLYPTDDTKTHACPSGANYNIVFCP